MHNNSGKTAAAGRAAGTGIRSSEAPAAARQRLQVGRGGRRRRRLRSGGRQNSNGLIQRQQLEGRSSQIDKEAAVGKLQRREGGITEAPAAKQRLEPGGESIGGGQRHQDAGSCRGGRATGLQWEGGRLPDYGTKSGRQRRGQRPATGAADGTWGGDRRRRRRTAGGAAAPRGRRRRQRRRPEAWAEAAAAAEGALRVPGYFDR